MDVYTRLSEKAHGEINDLTIEERDKLQDLIIENTADTVRKANDETLLQLGLEQGVIL